MPRSVKIFAYRVAIHLKTSQLIENLINFDDIPLKYLMLVVCQHQILMFVHSRQMYEHQNLMSGHQKSTACCYSLRAAPRPAANNILLPTLEEQRAGLRIPGNTISAQNFDEKYFLQKTYFFIF